MSAYWPCGKCGVRVYDDDHTLHTCFSQLEFTTKDSGERATFATGMVRDVQKGKARFDLTDKPMYWRWAELMGRGAVKYGERNWELAATQEELNRFTASAERHLQQWLRGDRDEDHAAAVYFNIAGAEHVKAKLQKLNSESSVPLLPPTV